MSLADCAVSHDASISDGEPLRANTLGHCIIAVIGMPDVVQRVVDAAGCPPFTKLPQGLAIASLGDAQIDALCDKKPGQHVDGFQQLSAGLKNALIAEVGSGQIVYLETEYFGGFGSQAAAVFEAGAVVFEAATPVGYEGISPDDPINSALRILGVTANQSLDEFDAVGLGEFRDLETLGLTE